MNPRFSLSALRSISRSKHIVPIGSSKARAKSCGLTRHVNTAVDELSPDSVWPSNPHPFGSSLNKWIRCPNKKHVIFATGALDVSTGQYSPVAWKKSKGGRGIYILRVPGRQFRSPVHAGFVALPLAKVWVDEHSKATSEDPNMREAVSHQFRELFLGMCVLGERAVKFTLQFVVLTL